MNQATGVEQVCQKIIRTLTWKDLLLTRLTLLLPLLYNFQARQTLNLISHHTVYLVLLLIFPQILHKTKIQLKPWQTLWISIGITLHPLGTLYNLYNQYWTYDIITHIYNSTIISSIAITYLKKNNYTQKEITLISLLWILITGTAWEILERQTDHLTVYGPTDTIKDYTSNLIGWLITIRYGENKLENITK